jgi:hypothetical protein
LNQDGRQAKNRKKGDGILIVHCCFSISQNERSNFNCSYMAMSDLTYIPFFLFLAWRPSWLEVGITGHNFGRVSPMTIPPKFDCNWPSGF